ncbi:MAG: undecaprenyldiphospho-muramoylpentapeptide beta-N-acetylglucosaminyltransferase [Pirellulaceae bacterium]|nr:undecaprenyldiphospho-muramoylpentapeptide beta-N-acetylglucosaminyltransferase [Pirellulaceae bacterium]
MISHPLSKPAHVNGEPPHVIFAGGGTGGHLFPGLAVAGELRRRRPDLRITFVGSGKSFEREWVASAEFDYIVLPCSPLPQRFWHLPGFLLDNAAGYRAARRLLREKHPSVVVGLGGYASVPVARTARRAGAKLVLLEQNVVPGRANRWLARAADAVCVAFPDTVERLRSRGEILVTGTPIRPGFTNVTPERDRRRLLVLGGSGGARSLNQQVPLALYKVRRHLQGGEIVHQAGEADLDATKRLYDKLGLKADVVPFIVDMPRMLGWAGLAISRAGGSALAELAAAGVPAVLLPYPHAANDHQRKNAELFRDSGGCVLIDSREHDGRIDRPLAESLGAILSDPLRRERLSYTMQCLARPDAARDVANIVMRLAADKPLPQRLPCQETSAAASVVPPPLRRAPRPSRASETDREHEYSLL